MPSGFYEKYNKNKTEAFTLVLHCDYVIKIPGWWNFTGFCKKDCFIIIKKKTDYNLGLK